MASYNTRLHYKRQLTPVGLACLHNNPLKMGRHRKCPERYKFSRLGVYLGLKKDKYEVLDKDFVMQLLGKDISVARSIFEKYVFACNTKRFKEDVEFINEKTYY